MLNWAKYRSATRVSSHRVVLLAAVAAVLIAFLLVRLHSWTYGLLSLLVSTAAVLTILWWPSRTNEAAWDRRALIAALGNPSMTLEARIELVYLVVGNQSDDALDDLAHAAKNRALDPHLRMEIASILAEKKKWASRGIVRALVLDEAVPARTRLEAAAMMLDHDATTALACLAAIVRSPLAPGDVRLDAAVIHAEHEPDGLGEERAGELLASLASGPEAPIWIRTVATEKLAQYSRGRYLRSLWALAHDSRLGPVSRFKFIDLLAQHDPERAVSSYKAMAHDEELTWPVRLNAAFRLEAFAPEEGVQTMLALVKDPKIDKISSSEIVRKLTDLRPPIFGRTP